MTPVASIGAAAVRWAEDLVMGAPDLFARHTGFHMDDWPWWPGAMHWLYPVLFLAAIACVVALLFRKR